MQGMVAKELLSKSQLFQGLSPDERNAIAADCETVSVSAWRLIPLIMSVFGVSWESGHRLLSREANVTLQHLIVIGGLVASLYATYRIIRRYIGSDAFSLKLYGLPYAFLLGSGLLFLLAL